MASSPPPSSCLSRPIFLLLLAMLTAASLHAQSAIWTATGEAADVTVLFLSQSDFLLLHLALVAFTVMQAVAIEIGSHGEDCCRGRRLQCLDDGPSSSHHCFLIGRCVTRSTRPAVLRLLCLALCSVLVGSAPVSAALEMGLADEGRSEVAAMSWCLAELGTVAAAYRAAAMVCQQAEAAWADATADPTYYSGKKAAAVELSTITEEEDDEGVESCTEEFCWRSDDNFGGDAASGPDGRRGGGPALQICPWATTPMAETTSTASLQADEDEE